MFGKRANIGKAAMAALVAIITIIVILLLVSALAPDLVASANNMSASGLPLANLFNANGIVLTIVVVGILATVITLAMKKKV